MDLLRGTAILLVIAHHLRLVQQIWDGSTPWAMVELSEALAPFRMPALLFASGLLLARSLRRPPGRFLAGKLRGLLWPWLLWSAVMLPILGWGHADEPLWWLNGMYTWFLAALFCYYVIGLVTRRIHPGWVALASVVAWTALPLLGTAHDMVGPRPDKFVFYAVFFFAGAALRPLLARQSVPWAVTVPALAVAAAWALHAARIDAEPRVPVLTQVVVLLAVVGGGGRPPTSPAPARAATRGVAGPQLDRALSRAPAGDRAARPAQRPARRSGNVRAVLRGDHRRLRARGAAAAP